MLRFTLLGIPVGVHFSFLLIALLVMGNNFSGSEVAVFVLAIFGGVLVHEAGHALTARAFGASQVSITLFALGGVTVYSHDPPLSPRRRFLISAAGSAAGISAGGPLLLLWWLTDVFDGLSRLGEVGLRSFILAAAVWGVLNWIPIRPLDGGQMLTAALEIVVPQRADAIARVVTVVVGVAVIIVALAYGETFIAFFVGFLVFIGARPAPTSPESASERPTRESAPASEDPPEFPI